MHSYKGDRDPDSTIALFTCSDRYFSSNPDQQPNEDPGVSIAQENTVPANTPSGDSTSPVANVENIEHPGESKTDSDGEEINIASVPTTGNSANAGTSDDNSTPDGNPSGNSGSNTDTENDGIFAARDEIGSAQGTMKRARGFRRRARI